MKNYVKKISTCCLLVLIGTASVSIIVLVYCFLGYLLNNFSFYQNMFAPGMNVLVHYFFNSFLSCIFIVFAICILTVIHDIGIWSYKFIDEIVEMLKDYIK